jgi:multidrug resistance efflux pump
MKYLIFLLPIFLFGTEYYGKVEPFKKYTITSKTNGKVIFVNDEAKGKVATSEIIVKLDSQVSQINYQVAKEVFEIKESQYNRIKDLRTKTKTEKDLEKINYLNAKKAYIVAKDSYFAKTLRAKDLYIYNILVEIGGYVNFGTPLFEAYDISRSRITIYLTREDLKDIKNKTIIVNGQEGKYTIESVMNVADKKFVSSYKLELVGGRVERFSDIVKVEIK